MQNGGELSVSSETPAAFPKDIIRTSNSLQTLHTLLLQCVPALVCTHTSVVWLSSQNCGQIALSCSYSGMMFFFHHSALVFILLFHSPFTLPPLYPPTHPTYTNTHKPSSISLSSCPHIPRSLSLPYFILHSHVKSQFSIPSSSLCEYFPTVKDSPVCFHVDRIHKVLLVVLFLLFWDKSSFIYSVWVSVMVMGDLKWRS